MNVLKPVHIGLTLHEVVPVLGKLDDVGGTAKYCLLHTRVWEIALHRSPRMADFDWCTAKIPKEVFG